MQHDVYKRLPISSIQLADPRRRGPGGLTSREGERRRGVSVQEMRISPVLLVTFEMQGHPWLRA